MRSSDADGAATRTHAPTAGGLTPGALQELAQTVESWESNPAVNMIVLSGPSSGLRLGALRARVSDTHTRARAAAEVRAVAEAVAAVATCTKPVASTIVGETSGAALGIALNARFPYLTSGGRVCARDGEEPGLPLGGLSYALTHTHAHAQAVSAASGLSRSAGIGMYLALTGSSLSSEDAFWAGLTPYFGAGEDTARVLAEYAADMGSFAHAITTPHGRAHPYMQSAGMGEDPVYRASLATLRNSRAESRLAQVLSNLSEDVAREAFEEYLRLKRWYTHMCAGDRASAAAAYTSPEASLTETGDLFDFGQSHAIDGRDELSEPTWAVVDRREQLIGTVAHANTVRSGILDAGPDAGMLERLRIINTCFGGDITKGDAVLQVSAPVTAPPRTREQFLQSFTADGKTPAPLDGDWEKRLPENVQSALMAVYERMDITPVATELPAIAAAVRAGVARAWPNGNVADVVLDDLCFTAGVPDRRQAKDVVSRGISYVTAALHGLRGREAWLLEDPGLLARDARAAADELSKRVRRTDEGAELSPRIDADPDGLLYDLREEEDIFWPIRGTGDAVSDARELEFRRRREDLPPSAGLPARPRVQRHSSVAHLRRDLMRQLARTALGASAYPNAVQSAIASLEEQYGQHVHGVQPLPDVASTSVARRDRESVPGAPTASRVVQFAGDMVQALQDIRKEILVAARDMAAVAPPSDAPPAPTGKHVRVGPNASAATLECVTDDDLLALARLNLDDPVRLELLQTSIGSAPAADASESAEIIAMRRLLRIWLALRRTIRETGDRRPLAGDALPADVAAAGVPVSSGPGGATRPAAGARARGDASAPASPPASGGKDAAAAASPRFVSIARLSPDAVQRVHAALRRYAAAEAYLMGHRLHDTLRFATVTPDGNAEAAADEVYVLAKNAEDGSVALRRLAPVTSAPGAAVTDSAPAPTAPTSSSPLDAIAPARLPSLASTLPSALSGSASATSTASASATSAVDAPEKWDVAHVREALTHAQYLLASFGLPRTRDTVAAGQVLVRSLKAQADARLAPPHVSSVDEVVRRLRAEAKASMFAKETLARLEAQPATTTRAIHAMLVHASTLNLRQCIELEYRAFLRMAAGALPADALAQALQARLRPEEQFGEDLHLRPRPIEVAVHRHRAEEAEAWSARLPAYFESGLADGALGDVMRRRLTWYRAPHIGWDGEGYAAPAHSDTALAEGDEALSREVLGMVTSDRVSSSDRAAILKRIPALRRALGIDARLA